MMNAKQKQQLLDNQRQEIVDNIAKLVETRNDRKASASNTEVIKAIGVMIAERKL